MAELTRRIIQYEVPDVLHFTTAQQYMASEVADSINTDVERFVLTAAEAREVLRFLLARLEGK